MAACKACEMGAGVLILEKMNRAGKKLLITGNGRCNITNTASIADFVKRIYPNGRFLKHAFSQFFNKDIIAFLEANGVATKVEENGKVYPVSDTAGDVLSVFLNKIHRNNGEIKYNCNVTGFEVDESSIISVKYTDEDNVFFAKARCVILCTGGLSYPATGSTGDGYTIARTLAHTITPTRPSLVPLITKGDKAQILQGVSLSNVRVSVWTNNKKHSQGKGELLFTHFGLSGPLIHSLSRGIVEALDLKQKVTLSMDLMPDSDEAATDKILLADLNRNGKKRIDNVMKLWLQSKLISVFLSECGINAEKEAHQLTAEERRKIRILLKDFRFEITSHRSYKEAIITAGGVSTDEINAKTMQSKLIDNLYFAGEVIDLDGDTGGYNLQIAYSTGWVAAVACCSKLGKE